MLDLIEEPLDQIMHAMQIGTKTGAAAADTVTLCLIPINARFPFSIIVNYKCDARGEFDVADKPALTMIAGIPLSGNQNSMFAGPRGRVLIQDYQLIEKLAHQNRERILERTVHAKGWGAFGTLTITNDITRYTKAKVFSLVGKKTEMPARFSTVAATISSLVLLACSLADTQSPLAYEATRWATINSLSAPNPVPGPDWSPLGIDSQYAPRLALVVPASLVRAAVAPRRDTSRDATADLFGEVAIPVSHLAIERRWQAIAPFHPEDVFGATCEHDRALCNSGLMHVWLRLRSAFSGERSSRLEIITSVNTEVNAAIRYENDSDNYGDPNYWASPAEMARRGSADCKEFALAKMWMLSALDIPASSMLLVVVKNTRRGLGHMVLSVNLSGTNLILDNVTSEIRSDREIPWYQPLYSVSMTGSWIYGVRRPPPREHARVTSTQSDVICDGLSAH